MDDVIVSSTILSPEASRADDRTLKTTVNNILRAFDKNSLWKITWLLKVIFWSNWNIEHWKIEFFLTLNVIMIKIIAEF